jgi:hypothetical protein
MLPAIRIEAPKPQPSFAPGEQLRLDLAELAAIERPSASPGERRSARWIEGKLGQSGIPARIEEEAVAGSYWLPLSLLSAGGLAGAAATWAGRPDIGVALSATAAAAIADDLGLGLRWFRRLLPRHTTYNVVASLGDPGAPLTVVFVAHHDAARSGFIFDPTGNERLVRAAPGLVERLDTGPPLFWPVIAGPAAVALGTMMRRRALQGLGALLSATSLAVFADVGRHRAVPGAIDNASGVIALIELARRFAAAPPEGVRVLLVFTGSEEALWEGVQAFGRRHFGSLPTEDTLFVNVDQVGDSHLDLVRGEGAVWMRHYPPEVHDYFVATAREVGTDIRFGNLRSRTGSDGQIPLLAGYPTAALQSVTEHKMQTAYHWPTDTPDKVDYRTLAAAVELCETATRRLPARWPLATPDG